jgi:hypothetical protein
MNVIYDSLFAYNIFVKQHEPFVQKVLAHVDDVASPSLATIIIRHPS